MQSSIEVKTKTAKCKVCKTPFTPFRPLQNWCSVDCAVTLGQQAIAKKKAKDEAADRKADKAKLDAMRTKPQLTKLAQQAFNAFIRARDAGKPCISCGTTLSNEPNTYDAGHYRSVGSAPHMRFVEDNCHGQCKHCNNFLAGNHVEYRKGLVARIGLRSVELIEADTILRKYSHEGLIEIARHYRAEARRILRK
jgi:hypothetical protein